MQKNIDVKSANFEGIRKELERNEERRESAIRLSRDIIKCSKQIIYALHRDETSVAEKHLQTIKKQLKSLPEGDVQTDMVTVAKQEFVEAATYFEIQTKNRLPSAKDLDVDSESYLLGLCDLTGELMRRVVNDILKENYQHAELIKNLVDALYGEFLKFEFRNGDLRRKADQIKWNLAKIEDAMYDVKMRRH